MRAGDQLLARARLPQHQHAGVGGAHQRDLLAQRAAPRAELADDARCRPRRSRISSARLRHLAGRAAPARAPAPRPGPRCGWPPPPGRRTAPSAPRAPPRSGRAACASAVMTPSSSPVHAHGRGHAGVQVVQRRRREPVEGVRLGGVGEAHRAARPERPVQPRVLPAAKAPRRPGPGRAGSRAPPPRAARRRSSTITAAMS